MRKFSFFILIVGILSLCACVTKKLRTPAQTLEATPEIPEAQKRSFTNLSSRVKVPSPSLNKAELAPYIRQCHMQMVENLLDFSVRLQKIKNFVNKNIQVGPLKLTLLDSVTSEIQYTSWNFNFTVSDQNGVEYHGYIYTETKKGLPLIYSHPDGTYEYQCWYARDGWIFDAAVLKDDRGRTVFSSSCAQKMLHGENTNERCEAL